MKKMLIVLFVMLICSTSLFAQANDAARNEMKKLQWMVGKWEGDVTMWQGAGNTRIINQTENIEGKLDGLVITMEGIGKEKGKEVFHAFGVLSYDVNAKKYIFRAFVREGNYIDADTSLDDKAFVWRYTDPRLGKVRYTVSLADPNRWNEVGEFSRDEGKTWTKFIELNLKRKS